MRWNSNRLLMVRPRKFGSNSETQISNSFQKEAEEGESKKIEEKVTKPKKEIKESKKKKLSEKKQTTSKVKGGK